MNLSRPNSHVEGSGLHAIMNASSSVESSVKDLEDLWLQHKDVIHQLYIIDNKTLTQVKDAMENEHDFPLLRLVQSSSIVQSVQP